MADKKATPASPGDVSPGYKPLVDSIAAMFEDPEFSDFFIKCEDKTWNVHKNIIAARSDFFKQTFAGGFRESQEGVVLLSDDDKGVVNEMLRYIYTADYQEEHTAENRCFTPLLLTVHVHTIADKYNIPALAELAEAKFKRRIVAEWNTDDFSNSVEEMYATAPHSKGVMHTDAVRVSAEHAKELYEQDFAARFREVASKTPEFVSALAAELVKGANAERLNPGEVRYECNACHETWASRAPPRAGIHSYNDYNGTLYQGTQCLQCGHADSYDTPFWSIVTRD